MKMTHEPVTKLDVHRAELVAASPTPQTTFEQFARDDQLRAAQVLDDRRRVARHIALSFIASSVVWAWLMTQGALPDLPTGWAWAVLAVTLAAGIGHAIRWHGRAKVVRQLRFHLLSAK